MSDVYVCCVSCMLPQEILKMRCSEITSEAILGQKQSCSNYMVHRVLHLTVS